MDFQNDDRLEERSSLMQIDNAGQEGLESNSEDHGSGKERSSGDQPI